MEGDKSSEFYLQLLGETQKIAQNKVSGVRTVLVVMSSRAMVFDVEALRQKILSVYRDAAVFFVTTSGKPMGVRAPHSVDLLIDFTGPGQRQGLFYARKLRARARFAVGRKAGFFRKRIYDRIFDESVQNIPRDLFDRERFAQKAVLALAGVPVVPASDVTEDRAQTIALELPPLAGE